MLRSFTYNPLTVEHKRLEPITETDIREAFKREDLHVFTDSKKLSDFLKDQEWKDTNLLLMSSGTFGELDFKLLAEEILK